MVKAERITKANLIRNHTAILENGNGRTKKLICSPSERSRNSQTVAFEQHVRLRMGSKNRGGSLWGRAASDDCFIAGSLEDGGGLCAQVLRDFGG